MSISTGPAHKTPHTISYAKGARVFLPSTSSAISLFGSRGWFRGLVSSLGAQTSPTCKDPKANISLALGSDVQDDRTPFSRSPYPIWQPPWQEDSGWASQTNPYLESAAYNQIRCLLPKKGCLVRCFFFFLKKAKKYYFVIHLFLHIDLQHTDNRTPERVFSLLKSQIAT